MLECLATKIGDVTKSAPKSKLVAESALLL